MNPDNRDLYTAPQSNLVDGQLDDKYKALKGVRAGVITSIIGATIFWLTGKLIGVSDNLPSYRGGEYQGSMWEAWLMVVLFFVPQIVSGFICVKLSREYKYRWVLLSTSIFIILGSIVFGYPGAGKLIIIFITVALPQIIGAKIAIIIKRRYDRSEKLKLRRSKRTVYR